MEISLREISLNDTDNIVRWRNSDFVLENFVDQNLITNDSHVAYYNSRIITGLVKQFIIVCDGKDVGTTFLRDIDYETKQAEFGILIGEKDYLSKGVGRKACELIVNYGFDVLKLDFIFLRVLKENIRAQKSYMKAGFMLDDSLNKDNDDSLVFMSIGR